MLELIMYLILAFILATLITAFVSLILYVIYKLSYIIFAFIITCISIRIFHFYHVEESYDAQSFLIVLALLNTVFVVMIFMQLI